MKRVAFAVLMMAGVAGFAEAAGAAFYFLVLPAGRREVVETALGLRAPEFNNVLRYRPHPYLDYVCNPDYVAPDGSKPHGDLGIRATDVALTAKRPGVFRIVAIGGSTTYGLYAADAGRVWPALVGEALRRSPGIEVEVVNAGVPNYTTFELLGVASMWLPELDADLVLVHTGLNDAFSVGFPDEGGLDGRHFRHAWSYRPLARPIRFAMRTSYLARALGTGWLSRSGHQIGDMTPAMQFPVPSEDEVANNVRHATGRYFRRNLETLVVLIRNAGARPVFVDMPLNPRFRSGRGMYYDAVSKAVVRNNGIMAEVGADRAVPVVDLYSRMVDPGVFLDAAHVNDTGMRQKARIVVETLGPLVQRSRSARHRR